MSLHIEYNGNAVPILAVEEGVHVLGADNVRTSIIVDTIGTQGADIRVGRALGTGAALLAVTAFTNLGQFGFRGYDGVNWLTPAAGIIAQTNQDWIPGPGGNQSCYVYAYWTQYDSDTLTSNVSFGDGCLLHLGDYGSMVQLKNLGIGSALNMPVIELRDMTSSGAVAQASVLGIQATTFSSKNSITIARAASIHIESAPVAGSGVSITESLGLHCVPNAKFGGDITVSGVSKLLGVTGVYQGYDPARTFDVYSTNHSHLVTGAFTSSKTLSANTSTSWSGLRGIASVILSGFNATGNQSGYQGTVNVSGTGTASSIRASSASCTISGAANVTTSDLFYGEMNHSGTGTISSANVFEVGDVYGGGVITMLRGFSFPNVTTKGVTTQVFHSDLSSGTNQWALHMSGTAQNYIFGVTGIGIAASSSAALTVAASTTGVASLRIPHGTAPSSPVDGDEWTTTSGKFIRINGTTKQFTLV